MEPSTSNLRNRLKIKFVKESEPVPRVSAFSLVLQNAAKERVQPPRPDKSRWTCTICSTTMSLKDATAHKQGRRHKAALANKDETLGVELESHPFRTEAAGAQGNSMKDGDSQAVATATSSKTSPGKPESSTITGLQECISSSKPPRGAQKRKGKTTAKPKNKTKGMIPPSILADPDDILRDTEATGWFIDSTLHFASMDPVPGTRYQLNPSIRRMDVDDNDPLAAFFALYSPFRYNRASYSHDEYRRLCAYFGWPTRRQQEYHAERDQAWESFRIAMVEAFNSTFGDDENDIEAWGRMCVLVGMESIHDTLEGRREAMLKTHVNLCDLLDTTRQRTKVQVFASEEDLREYTLETGRIFPREEAYAGGLLKYLLREITGTYHGSRKARHVQRRKDRRSK